MQNLGNNRGFRGVFWCWALSFLFYSIANADIYHYKNIFIGERASGLGGAFAGIADDPSGIYYNPAGLVYSMENYFSVSANAYSVTQEKVKDIVPGQNYNYTSKTLIPAFFGFTQAYGKNRLGIAVIMPNSDLIDQDDTIQGLYSGAGQASTFKRRLFQSDETYLIGPAFAREVTQNFAIGVSLLGFYRVLTTIDNQFVKFNPLEGESDARYFIQNTSIAETSYGLSPKLGMQLMPSPKWSIGFTASKTVNIGGSGTSKSLATILQNGTTLNGLVSHDLQQLEKSISYNLPSPLEVSLGTAYFFNKEFLLSFQFDYNTGDSSYKEFQLSPTWNVAVGTEYYLTNMFAIRSGLFTNKAKTPSVSSSGVNQAPHVDLYGGSLALAMTKPGSSLALGASYMVGKGEAQAIADTPTVQTVNQNTLTVFLAGSYQM